MNITILGEIKNTINMKEMMIIILESQIEIIIGEEMKEMAVTEDLDIIRNKRIFGKGKIFL